MLTQDIINFYSNLLVMQYATQPNAVATVQAFVGELVQNQSISQLQAAFNLNTADGALLDKVGSYRGVNRQVFGLVTGSYMALPSYSDPSTAYFGLGSYSGSVPGWNFLQYNDDTTFSVGDKLTDSQMRRLIELKADIQSAPLTLGVMDAILFETFGPYVNVVDVGNMTMVYQHQIADPDPDGLFNVAALAGALPHPCGVSISVIQI